MNVNDIEKEAMDALVLFWNKYTELKPQHPDEADEIRSAVHSIQNSFAMRQQQRSPTSCFFNPIY